AANAREMRPKFVWRPERVALALETEHRDANVRQMGDAELVRPPRRVQWIPEPEQAREAPIPRGEMGRGAAPPPPATHDEGVPPLDLPGRGNDRAVARLQLFRLVRDFPVLFDVEEIEGDDVKAAGGKGGREPHHETALLPCAGAVCEDKCPPERRRR